MINIIKDSERYIRKMNVVDFGLLKVCLFSLGLLAGTAVPNKHKKKTAMVAGAIYAMTYAPLMTKYFMVMLKNEKDSVD